MQHDKGNILFCHFINIHHIVPGDGNDTSNNTFSPTVELMYYSRVLYQQLQFHF